MAVSESIKDLTAALAKAQIAFKPIKKTEKVDYQTTSGRKKYNYAPLSEVIEATKQALCDNGLCVIQTTKLVEGSVLLETLLSHSSGEWKSGELYVGKQDQPPQSEGSALTYKRRYGLSAILNVSSEEDDDAEGTKSTKEMTEGTVSSAVEERRTVDKSEHYCEVHGVNFFMKGKMKSYAHPVKDENGEDTGEWCHEHSTKVDNKVDKRGEFEKEGRNLVDEAMTSVKPHSLAVPSTTEASTTDSKGFANAGEFYTACNTKYKLTKSKVDPQIVGCDLTTAKGRQVAWTLITALFGEPDEKPDTQGKLQTGG